MFAAVRQALAEFIRPTPPLTVRSGGFDGAAPGRRGYGVRRMGPVNAEVGAAGQTLADRSAYLVSNNGLIAHGAANLVAETIGSGIRPLPRHPDPSIRAELTARFDRFWETCDADGRGDFGTIQASVFREIVVRGAGLAQLVNGDDGFQIRVLSADQIDRTRSQSPGSGAIEIQGVRFDAAGRRSHYWIHPHREADVFATWAPAVLAPADDVLHTFASIAPGQVHGVPWTTSILLAAAEFDKLCDALLMGASVAAMFCASITTENDIGDGSDPFGDEAQPSLEPGTILRLKGGQKLTTHSPQQAGETAAFVKSQLHALAAGLGVPTFMLDNDVSQANYSSLRASLLPFRRRIEQFQYNVFVPQFLRPVWRRFIMTEFAAGSLDGDDVEQYMAVDWITPRPMQVDPAKDVAAVREMIAAGLMSRRQAVNELGWSVEELDAEIAADRAREKELGLSFGQAPAAPQQESVK